METTIASCQIVRRGTDALDDSPPHFLEIALLKGDDTRSRMAKTFVWHRGDTELSISDRERYVKTIKTIQNLIDKDESTIDGLALYASIFEVTRTGDYNTLLYLESIAERAIQNPYSSTSEGSVHIRILDDGQHSELERGREYHEDWEANGELLLHNYEASVGTHKDSRLRVSQHDCTENPSSKSSLPILLSGPLMLERIK
ncbi:uncharacterized protein I303_101265 [Kwoniella dejecticola CBS 10117]|uniref:Uncharacterized protein n=1 Tax=Kwoniella dejecticola CBS 10117 TaxID=1296121 RepID=A0A1A6AH95_9TREE|nr:uncharacterized protein I303_01272 [Kwoniella dejecticola CBS 10117]OBR89445.1 hypothetical protein I303_01272 [Kwoniella dejecticola CBS 10117]